MAGAHVCMKCGTDMASCRAVDDPQYGLPLVFCPECGWACARHVHRIHRRRRNRGKVRSAIALLLLQGWLVFLLTMVNLGSVLAFHDSDTNLLEPAWVLKNWYFVLMLVSIGPILTGVWLTAGLMQIRRWKAYAGWSLWMAVWITWLTLGLPLAELNYEDMSMSEFRAYIDVMQATTVYEWMDYLVVYAWVMIPTIAIGLPTGRLFLKLQRRSIRRRWSKMRLKRVKRRQAL